MINSIKVGMADYKVLKGEGELITLGLGSCVGIILYDPNTRIAGMAHIMLPSSQNMRNQTNLAKFADTCLDIMFQELIKMGANKSRMVSKIAGGAQMFSISLKNENLNIGKRNVIAVKEKLAELRIPIVAEDVHGNYGRTIRFNPMNGELHIKSIGKGEQII